MASVQRFTCPSCGGNTAYAGTDPTVVCEYCGNTVAVPDALREPGLQAEAKKTVSQTTRYLVIFLILVFGVPTCLGLAGSFIGIAASLLVPIITLFAAAFSGS